MAGQLPDKYMDQLESWVGTGPNATTFHQKCDNQGPTVTVLYNQQDSVYGGYGSASWNSSGVRIQDTNAFLFQLTYSGSDKYTKFQINKNIHGLHGGTTYGPTFGGGPDLNTFTDTVNSPGGYFALNCYTQFGYSYDAQGLNIAQINNGNLHVTDLEVYSIKGRVNKTIHVANYTYPCSDTLLASKSSVSVW